MDIKVTVYPEPDRFPEIARALLDVADHPNQVVSVSHPRAGFIVPKEVFDRLEATRGAEAPKEPETPKATPAKRGPGRPRKVVDAPPAPVLTADPVKEE